VNKTIQRVLSMGQCGAEFLFLRRTIKTFLLSVSSQILVGESPYSLISYFGQT